MGLGSKFLSLFTDSIDDGDEYEYDDMPEDEIEQEEQPIKQEAATSNIKFGKNKEKAAVKKEAAAPEQEPEEGKQGGFFSRRASKVVRLQQVKDTEVVVIKPTALEDSQDITNEVKMGNPVVINFEDMEIEVAQRIIDFVSGACFAVNGNLRAVNKVIFIVAPENVDIVGDITTELINTGLIVPNFSM